MMVLWPPPPAVFWGFIFSSLIGFGALVRWVVKFFIREGVTAIKAHLKAQDEAAAKRGQEQAARASLMESKLDAIGSKQSAQDVWLAKAELRLDAIEKAVERFDGRMQDLEGWGAVANEERKPFVRERRRDKGAAP